MNTLENNYSGLSGRVDRNFTTSELNSILYSLGYDKILRGLNLEKISQDKRKKLILVTDYLRVVLAEAMKPEEERDLNRMHTFLNMALQEIDRFHMDQAYNNQNATDDTPN